MMGAGDHVFAVWGYIIANTINSQVEVNPRHVALLIGMEPREVSAALKFLESPDPESRNPKNEGRRIVHLSGFSYHVSNHAEYRSFPDDDARRQYFAQKQREHRARVKDQSQTLSKTVKPCQGALPGVTHTEAEAEAEAEAEIKPPNPPLPGGPHRSARVSVVEPSDDFLEFWEEYPRKVAQKKAWEAWRKANPPLSDCLRALSKVKKTAQWQRGKEYIPHAATWLNQERWDDEL
jgi:hypothetical protein